MVAWREGGGEGEGADEAGIDFCVPRSFFSLREGDGGMHDENGVAGKLRPETQFILFK